MLAFFGTGDVFIYVKAIEQTTISRNANTIYSLLKAEAGNRLGFYVGLCVRLYVG